MSQGWVLDCRDSSQRIRTIQTDGWSAQPTFTQPFVIRTESNRQGLTWQWSRRAASCLTRLAPSSSNFFSSSSRRRSSSSYKIQCSIESLIVNTAEPNLHLFTLKILWSWCLSCSSSSERMPIQSAKREVEHHSNLRCRLCSSLCFCSRSLASLRSSLSSHNHQDNALKLDRPSFKSCEIFFSQCTITSFCFSQCHSIQKFGQHRRTVKSKGSESLNRRQSYFWIQITFNRCVGEQKRTERISVSNWASKLERNART